MAFAIPTTKKRPRFGIDVDAQGRPLDDSWFPGLGGVPAAGPSESPGGTGGTGGPSFNMPSLADILGGDSLYQSYLADLRAQGISDRAGLKEARQRAITNFGEVPDFRSMVGGGAVGDLEADITPDIRALAGESTKSGLSTVARLEDARKTAARQLTGFLASRGLLRSGETGHQQGRLQTDFTRSQFDARQQLLDYLAGYQSSFTQAEQQRKNQERQAQMSALQNWLALNPNTGAQTPPAATPPGATPPAALPPTPGTPGGLPHITQIRGIPKGATMNPSGTVFGPNGQIIGRAVQTGSGWVFQP